MDDAPPTWQSVLARTAGIVFGAGTQVGFLITVWYLFFFLKNGHPSSHSPWLAADLMLALQFAIIHSLLLYPRVKAQLTKFVPTAFYGCLFCVATCGCLAAIFAGWRATPRVVWQLSGTSAAGVRAGFYASWVALFYSLSISGLGYQTGLTPWWYWLRRQPAPRRQFVPRGAYRWLRHPIYLSFLGLIWFTPTMTWDHALLTLVWTAYILVGSYLKDERMAFYVGDEYRRYQARVAGYPLVFWGPLARRAVPAPQPAIPRHPTPPARHAA
jgi:protein-S-isoprenylcysteine O-methyltransferase Ste14